MQEQPQPYSTCSRSVYALVVNEAPISCDLEDETSAMAGSSTLAPPRPGQRLCKENQS